MFLGSEQFQLQVCSSLSFQLNLLTYKEDKPNSLTSSTHNITTFEKAQL